MTKRQLSRHKRDVLLRRYLKIGFGALFALIVIVIALGYWREEIAPGGEAILRVRGVPIATQTYAKVLGYRQFVIDRQIASIQAFAQQQPSAGDNEQSNDFLQQLVQQQLSQLQQQRATLEQEIITALVDDELVRQEAAKRGIALTPPEIEAEIVKRNTPATPEAQEQPVTDEATASTEATPAADPTPAAPTATPMPPEEVLAGVRNQLAELGLLTEEDYRELVVKPGMLRERLEAQLAEVVPTTAEQVWARHILLEQEEEAKEVLAKLQGGADFAALARELSEDASNKDKGGDLGWFLRGSMVGPFEEAAFSLQAGQMVSAPVQTSFGYHVIEVLGHEQARPLSEDQLERAKANALEEWLNPQRSDEKIVEYGYSWERVRWARKWIDENAKYLKAQQPPRR